MPTDMCFCVCVYVCVKNPLYTEKGHIEINLEPQ